MAGVRILGIAQDSEHNIWIAAGQRLYRYRDGSFVYFNSPNDLGGTRGIIDLAVDNSDAVWVILKRNIYRFRDNRFETVPALGAVKDQGLTRVSADSDGSIWILTLSQDAYCYRNGQLTAFGRNEGLPAYVKRVMRDRDGNTWFGSYSGIGRINGSRCTLFPSSTMNIPKEVNAIYEDREGNLWMGSEGQGLYRFTDGSFTPFGAQEGWPEGSVVAVCEDSDRDVWIATSDGLYRNGFTQAYMEEDRSLGYLAHTALLPDPRDRSIWIGTARGLFHRQGESFIQYTTKDGLPSDVVVSLCLDDQGTLWIGCYSGLVCFNKGRFFTPEACASAIRGEFVLYLAEDHEGGMWIGTPAGPMRYKGGQITRFSEKDGLGKLDCLGIYVDSEGVVWIPTHNSGLYRYAGDRFFTYFQRDGLISDQIYGIIDDPVRGDLWLGSNKGVFRVSKKQLDDFRAGRTKHIFGTTFGVGDGLKFPEINLNGFPNVWRAHDGKLLWATVSGVAAVDPNHIILHNAPNSVIIKGIVTDDQTQLAQRPEVAPGVRRLKFEYTASPYAAADKLRFRYRLDGVDQAWFDASQRREAFFTRLAPGNYRFRVQASGDSGATWMEPGAAIAFHVQPHFYQTWWFLVACGVIVAGMVWTTFMLRRRQLEARFRGVLADRVRVAGEIHDSLAQGFATAAMLLDSLDRLVPPDPPLKARLKSIRSILGSSLADARAMIATLRGQSIKSENLESALRNLVERSAAASRVPIQFDFQCRQLPSISSAVQQDLIRICQEAVNNAIRHANASHIWMKVELNEGEQLRLTVRDDGSGFDVNTVVMSGGSGHFGLTSLSERAHRIGGKLELRSQPGEGTEVELVLDVVNGASLS